MMWGIRRFTANSNNFFKNTLLNRSVRFVSHGATPEGTLRFSKRFPIYSSKAEGFSNTQLSNQWYLSPIGFGSKKSYDIANDQLAIQYAIQAGSNMIDTSTSYFDGESEQLIGTVINGMLEEKVIQRDEIIIASKVGTIKGSVLEYAKQQEENGTPYSNVVKGLNPYKVVDDYWHCIAPEFISDQLTVSLERMELQQLDILYLEDVHLSWDANDVDGKAFYEKLKSAFTRLEEEVDAGRIQYYGISSDTFTKDLSKRGNVSVERCLQIAKEVRSDHHFKFIQFPFNIQESDAYTNKNLNGKSLIQFAKENQLSCITARPLTAHVGNQIYQFINLEEPEDLHTLAGNLRTMLEDTIRTEQQVPWNWPEDGTRDPSLPHRSALSWGQIISQNMDQLASYGLYQQVLFERIRPELTWALKKLDQKKYKDWIIAYRYIIEKLLQTYERFLKAKHILEAQDISNQMHKIAPSLQSSTTLSQKTMRVLCSSGVDCVLVGMRTTAMVKDILFQLGPRIEQNEVEQILQNVKWKPINYTKSQG